MNEMYETSTSTIFQEFKDFVRDYYDRKDISTISLGSGIAQEEFEKLLKVKVEAVFKKLWGFQIDQVTYDRVRDALDLGKLPEGFIDPLNAGVDKWIKEEWNPVYKEAMTLAANGTAQITGMVGKIASATGVGVIFNPDTQRMLNIIDTEGLNLAVQLKKQQVMSLRTTLRRSIAEKWTRKRTHDEMKVDVSLTDRENKALERFTQRQRNEIYKDFKKRFPGLTEKELNKRVEAVVTRKRKVKYEKYRNGRSERFYRTELSRARNEGNLEGMQQAVNQGAIKNAKKKWVRTNEIDSWESSDRFNGKIIPFDGDFFKLFGKPKKTTMLNGKYPGEINELCIVQYFAEKGDGKPVAVEAVAAFVPAKTIKEAEEYAVKRGFSTGANYKGIKLADANLMNKLLLKARSQIKFEPILIDVVNKKRQYMAANRNHLYISRIMFSKKQQEKMVLITKKEYRKDIAKRIKKIEEALRDKDMIPFIRKQYLRDLRWLDEELKFRIQLAVDKDNVVGSTLYHELGHVIHGQRMNAFGDIKNPIPGMELLKSEWENVYKKLIKTGDILKISKYANKNENEGFAECFSMYFFEKEKLPKYVVKFIDKVLK